MPVVTRWMLKTSLGYLLLALIVGLIQAIASLLGPGSLTNLLIHFEPERIHLFVVGWLTLLIFGVAFWMFPKYSQAQPRGSNGLGWAAYGFLNTGLILRMIGESASKPGSIFGWVLVVSATFLWLAGLAFVINTWPRIKEK